MKNSTLPLPPAGTKGDITSNGTRSGFPEGTKGG